MVATDWQKQLLFQTNVAGFCSGNKRHLLTKSIQVNVLIFLARRGTVWTRLPGSDLPTACTSLMAGWQLIFLSPLHVLV